MSKRISHSLLDPYVGPPIASLYRWLPIPRRFPPEGIVLLGHLSAVAAAIGFAFSTTYWWGGLVVAIGVFGNHLADCIDGRHARATGQCRNGGELLDHFTDPLSFSYYLAGLAASCGRMDLGVAAVIILYATAVLTNIKAKMIGEFTLARFGPTEFKMLLILYGLAIMAHVLVDPSYLSALEVATWFLYILLAIGLVQLAVNLVNAVREVNEHGEPPDTSEWETHR